MDPDALVNWFTAQNGTFDRAALTFVSIDKLGWGAVALQDLQVNSQTRSTHPVSDYDQSSISKVTPSFHSPAI